jgi:hypothetical protein
MNYPDPRVEVSKNTLTPCPPLSHAKEGDISVHPGLGFPSLPGREGLGVSQDLMGTIDNGTETVPAELPQHSVYLPSYQIGKYKDCKGRFISKKGGGRIL